MKMMKFFPILDYPLSKLFKTQYMKTFIDGELMEVKPETIVLYMPYTITIEL